MAARRASYADTLSRIASPEARFWSVIIAAIALLAIVARDPARADCNARFALSNSDRNAVQSILQKLPARNRGYVIVLRRDGSVLGVVLDSKIQPCTAAPVARMVSAQDNEFVNSSGQIFYVPGSVPKPAPHPTPAPTTGPGGHPVWSQKEAAFAQNTGAFHGIRTLNGWSGVRATVSIPCGAAKFAVSGARDVETGYIYTGGWGAGHGTAVDAGLQKSSLQNSRDDYAMYWKYDGDAPVTVDYINKNLRFPCGNDGVELNLFPASKTLLLFSASGIIQNHQQLTFTIAQLTSASDGWLPIGGSSDDGIILKRMITIAQSPKTVAQNRQNGSYFGIFSNGSTTPLIQWSSCLVGRSRDPVNDTIAYSVWNSSNTWSASSAVVNYPPHSVVVRNPSGSICDQAAIDLGRSPF